MSSILTSKDEIPHPGLVARRSPAMQVVLLLAVIVPFLGLLFAVVTLWGWGCGWVPLGLLVGMYVLTVLGVTVGFHRLFTHRSFETNRAVQAVLGVCGSMAVQGPMLKWVATHRLHHQHSDAEGDPHTPHQYGKGFFGLLRGFAHAHMGWLFKAEPANLSHYVKDLRQSRLLVWVSALFPLWVALGLLIPALLGFLLGGGWWGALEGFIWGGLVRICLSHHIGWCINSVCHLWGSQPFANHDHSRNNVIFGVLVLGEGWHNNHHAYPSSARFGLRWWQVDVGYWVIRSLALLGLAWNVKSPGKQVAPA